MKSKLSAKWVALLAASALSLVGVGQALAQATYNPASKNFAGYNNVEQVYTFNLDITAPDKSAKTETGNVLGDWDASVTVSPAAFATVTVEPSTFNITAKETKTVKVTVKVAPGVAPGDYSFTVGANGQVRDGSAYAQAKGGGAMGTGGGCQVNVTVQEPTVTDTTPPTVQIAAPAEKATFTFCSAPISLSFTAKDLESDIDRSTVNASVNGTVVPVTVTGSGKEVAAEGAFLLPQIGTYTVTANAADTAGNPGSSSVDITVNYNLAWLPPLALGKSVNGGSTMPIKFSVRDCNGAFVNDPSVKVVVYQVTAGTAVKSLESVYGTGSTGVRIDPVDEVYIVNFQTAPGANNYRVDVSFAGVADNSVTDCLQGSKVFTTTLPGKK